MKQKIVIEVDVPEGKKAVWKDGKVVFKNIVPELPKTWEEFCEKYNKTVDVFWISNNSEILKQIEEDERLSDWDKNLLPSEQAANQHLVLMQLHQLRDCYRQGWVPNWNNENSRKFCIQHICTCNPEYSIIGSVIAPYFLSFQSEEVAEEFLNNFRDLIEQAGDLI